MRRKERTVKTTAADATLLMISFLCEGMYRKELLTLFPFLTSTLISIEGSCPLDICTPPALLAGKGKERQGKDRKGERYGQKKRKGMEKGG